MHTNFWNLFWNKTLHTSDSSSVHLQEFFTVNRAVVYVCHTGFADSLRAPWSCSQAVTKSVWYITLQCVQRKTPDDGQRNCPKHVEFYSKNKFEKLVHLVGFIIRNYHDARSSERRILFFVCIRIWYLVGHISVFVLIKLFMNNSAAHILRILLKVIIYVVPHILDCLFHRQTVFLFTLSYSDLWRLPHRIFCIHI